MDLQKKAWTSDCYVYPQCSQNLARAIKTKHAVQGFCEEWTHGVGQHGAHGATHFNRILLVQLRTQVDEDEPHRQGNFCQLIKEKCLVQN